LDELVLGGFVLSFESFFFHPLNMFVCERLLGASMIGKSGVVV